MTVFLGYCVTLILYLTTLVMMRSRYISTQLAHLSQQITQTNLVNALVLASRFCVSRLFTYPPMHKQAHRVIFRFGGVLAFVHAIHEAGGPLYERTHVYKWLRAKNKPGATGGVIPSPHWVHIIRAARFHRIPFSQLIVAGDAPSMPDVKTLEQQLENEQMENELFG